MACNKRKPKRRAVYESFEDTNQQGTAFSSRDDVGLPPTYSESKIRAAFRVVVVGRAGCGKSTICNALLNAEKDKFRAQKGMGSCTRHFQSEINEENKLQVVDTPDVFMRYLTAESARNKFREAMNTLTPSEMSTALLFPIHLDERFTQYHYDLCLKYLQLLTKPYTNTILVLIKAQQSDNFTKTTFLPKLQDVFNDRVIWLQKLPLEMKEREELINGVMEHLQTMKPMSLKPRESDLTFTVVPNFRLLLLVVTAAAAATSVAVAVLTIWRRSIGIN